MTSSVNDQAVNHRPNQRLLVGHGALLIFVGGIMGWGFLFFLMGEVSLWPLPGKIDYQMPGTYDAWRMAHMEGIVNGMFLWLAAAIYPLFPLGNKASKWLTYALLATCWSIVLASCLDPLFPDARGLMMKDGVLNNIAFLLFYVGVPGAMIASAYIAYKALCAKNAD